MRAESVKSLVEHIRSTRTARRSTVAANSARVQNALGGAVRRMEQMAVGRRERSAALAERMQAARRNRAEQARHMGRQRRALRSNVHSRVSQLLGGSKEEREASRVYLAVPAGGDAR